MKKAIIFDMDGVLIDSEPMYYERFRHFFNYYNVNISEKELKQLAGASSQTIWNKVLELWDGEKCLNNIKSSFHLLCDNYGPTYSELLFPRVKEVIEIFKKNKYKIALASSSPMQIIMQVLKETNLEIYFDVIVSGEMFKDGKPHPEIYLYTIQKLQIPAQQCIVIEDSTYGIRAANAAKVDVIAIMDDRFGFAQETATYLVEKIIDIVDLSVFKHY